MRFRALVLLLVLAIVHVPDLAIADEEDDRDGSSPPAPFLPVFAWSEPVPAPLREGVRAYRDGRFFDVLGHLRDFESGDEGGDDASFLRALALRALGWEELAVPLLRSVLEARPPSPYYPLALRELIEIHAEADRPGAVIDAYVRHFDKPLRARDPHSRRITRLLFEFGTLRSGRAKLSPAEKQRLANPDELAVRIEKERDRATDRLIYLSGIALLRSKRHSESLGALQRIGIESPYYPYALYTAAQNLFALGETRAAVKMADRLIRYPEPKTVEHALESRARLLKARMLLDTDALDRGIRVASAIADDDPAAESGRLLIAEALVDAGQPALALAYAGEGEGDGRGFELAARRGLALGGAYSALGDATSAARALRTAVRRVQRARREDSENAVERLAPLAREQLDGRLRRERERRVAVSAGIDRVLAYEKWGSWSFGRLLRGAGVVLGLRPHGELARGTTSRPQRPAGRDDAWLAYLQSQHRTRTELFLTRAAELGEKTTPRESAFRVVNAYLTWLEHGSEAERPELARAVTRRAARFATRLREEGRLDVPPLEIDPRTPLGPQLAAFRRAIAAAQNEAVGSSRIAPSDDVRDEAQALLRRGAEGELGRFLATRATARKRVERDLEMTLVDVLAGEAGVQGRGGGE